MEQVYYNTTEVIDSFITEYPVIKCPRTQKEKNSNVVNAATSILAYNQGESVNTLYYSYIVPGCLVFDSFSLRNSE